MNKPKNILFIHCDQLRADCLGYAGNPDIKTPNIDALAVDSVNYTNQFCVYPICTPSRYSLWSGMYVHQHGAWNNGASLPTGYQTLPGILHDHGFDTAVVGKMHFTPTYQDIGFKRMRLAEQNGTGRYEDDYHNELTQKGILDVVDLHHQSQEFRLAPSTKLADMVQCMTSDLPKELHTTGWTTLGALDEISSWDDSNHLLMIGYIKPHHPFDPPKPYDTMYDPKKLTMLPDYTDKPFLWDTKYQPGILNYEQITESDMRQAMAYYYGAITQIDDGVGEIIALLKDKGLYDDTMIIFTADHGDYLGQHHMLLKCNHMYDSLAKIPLLIKYPGGQTGTDSRLSENIDIMPTVLEALGIEIPSSVQGQSLISGKIKDYAFSEGQYGSDKEPCMGYMIRTEKYKLLVRGTLSDGMLFDLTKDPYEKENVFHNPAYADALNEMKGHLIQTMLFTGTGKLHCDHDAAQTIPQETLDQRRNFVHNFVKTHFPQHLVEGVRD